MVQAAHMKTIGDRLIHARTQRGLTQTEAIERTGINYATFYQHEANTRAPGRANQDRYASAYSITIDWLMRGKGMGPAKNIKIEGRVGAGSKVIDAGEQLGSINPLSAFPADCFALQIEGESQLPYFIPGDLIICQPVNDVRHVLRKIAVVTLDNDVRLVKRVMPGERGRYTLESLNALPIENALIASAARIIWHRLG
jgi:transcriptional regulator with XRE-family HTH domain